MLTFVSAVVIVSAVTGAKGTKKLLPVNVIVSVTVKYVGESVSTITCSPLNSSTSIVSALATDVLIVPVLRAVVEIDQHEFSVSPYPAAYVINTGVGSDVFIAIVAVEMGPQLVTAPVIVCPNRRVALIVDVVKEPRGFIIAADPS